jgi:hypothetical protein
VDLDGGRAAVSEASLGTLVVLGLLGSVAVLRAKAKAAADAVVDELVLLLTHLVGRGCGCGGRSAVTAERDGGSVGILALDGLLGRLQNMQ